MKTRSQFGCLVTDRYYGNQNSPIQSEKLGLSRAISDGSGRGIVHTEELKKR